MSSKVMQHLRGGHLAVLAAGVAMIVAGMALIFSGLWLNWDFVQSIFFQNAQTNPTWQFCLPVYIKCYDVHEWSAPFDISMGFIILGAILELAGAFVSFITYENMP